MLFYFALLKDPATVDSLLAFLEHYIPYTLGLIGDIVNSPELVKAINVQRSYIPLSKSTSANPFNDRLLSLVPTNLYLVLRLYFPLFPSNLEDK